MKKKLRVIPLATAAFLAMGMSAVSAKTIYFATDKDAANFIKADAAGLKANPEYLAKYREAQNKGWKIVVEDNGKTIDWAKALDQKVDYSKAVENSASYQGQAPAENKVGKEVKPDGKVEDKAPVVTPVASVVISNSASDAELTVGSATDSTLTLTATAKDKDGKVVEGKTATWTSDNSGVATVDANGKVTAVAAGTAVITATIDGKTATVTVTVKAGEQQTKKANATVTISPAIPTFKDIVLNSSEVQGGVKFQVEGSKLVQDFGKSVTINTSNTSAKVYIKNANGETLAEGVLSLAQSGTVTFDVTVTKEQPPENTVKKAVFSVTVSPAIPTFKDIVLNSTEVQGGVKFQVEGSKLVQDLGKSVTINNGNSSVKVYIKDANGVTLAEGTLDISATNSNLQIDVK